jgi:hypothetical protein
MLAPFHLRASSDQVRSIPLNLTRTISHGVASTPWHRLHRMENEPAHRQELFKIPRIRQYVSPEGEFVGKSNQLHASWLELFQDLIYVGAIGKIGHSLAADLTWSGLFHYTLMFFPLMKYVFLLRCLYFFYVCSKVFWSLAYSL